MPEHDVYIDAFWGRGTIAKRKKPSRFTIGIDLDEAAMASGRGVALMFRADGMRWIADYFCVRLPLPMDVEAPPGDILRSGATSYVATLANTVELHGGRPGVNNKYCRSMDARNGGDGHLPPNGKALPGHDDIFLGVTRPVIAELNGEGCGEYTFGGMPWSRHFVYLDPPYMGRSRYYRFNFSEEEHRQLCRLFKVLPCPAILSGYWSRVYAEELNGIRSIRVPTVNRAGKRVEEVIWMNYPIPTRYHDVRFVGKERRERERIRRRAKTWANGLLKMKVNERQAIFEACSEIMRNREFQATKKMAELPAMIQKAAALPETTMKLFG